HQPRPALEPYAAALEVKERRHARRVGELERGDVEIERPALLHEGMALHGQLLRGLVGQPAFDVQPRRRLSVLDSCDAHHDERRRAKAVPTPQGRGADRKISNGVRELCPRSCGCRRTAPPATSYGSAAVRGSAIGRYDGIAVANG